MRALHEFSEAAVDALLLCQREAAETAIFLAEVASRHCYTDWRRRLAEANEEHNSGLPRIALKMATVGPTPRYVGGEVGGRREYLLRPEEPDIRMVCRHVDRRHCTATWDIWTSSGPFSAPVQSLRHNSAERARWPVAGWWGWSVGGVDPRLPVWV